MKSDRKLSRHQLAKLSKIQLAGPHNAPTNRPTSNAHNSKANKTPQSLRLQVICPAITTHANLATIWWFLMWPTPKTHPENTTTTSSKIEYHSKLMSTHKETYSRCQKPHLDKFQSFQIETQSNQSYLLEIKNVNYFRLKKQCKI